MAEASKFLISGSRGFAGSHLLDLLATQEVDALAPSRSELDFCDGTAVRSLFVEVRPTAVIHLAAFSSPSLSWESPNEAIIRNVEMTINVLEAARHEAPEAPVVLVGSGQIYGEPSSLPVVEDSPMAPGNPYAISKASGDMLGRQYAEAHGMRVVRMRPFNHAGPRQSEEYVVSSLASQVAKAESDGQDECVLRTGNPDSARDFTDVRDVVRAYLLATEDGVDGGAFNVCSGRATSIAELVEMAGAEAEVPVRHEVDQARLRRHDAPILYGSHQRLTSASGWRPEISLEKTMADTIDWWRTRLSGSAWASVTRKSVSDRPPAP